MRSLVTLVFVFSVTALFSIACLAQEVQYSFAPDADFSKFKTYKWKRAEKAQYQDAVADRILKATIGEQLAAKGLTNTEDDSADLYVMYQLAVGHDVEWSSFNADIPWQNDLVGYGANTNATTMIRRGWLMLDLFDTHAKKYVWRVNAVKTLGEKNDPNKMEKNARKAMAKIFKKYPPTMK